MSERRQRTLYRLCLAAVLLLAASLRFYRLDASSLWSDEGNTWAMLGRSYAEIAAAAAADIHPPGYYWLLKGWAALFGTSAWAMRSFSAAAGVLLVLVVERIGRLILADSRAVGWLALLAALTAAVNPLLVYYSQEARMYMLLALLGAGVLWALLGLAFLGEVTPRGGPHLAEVPTSRRSPPRGGVVAVYVICAALGLWTHYSFAIVLAAANLAWFGRWLWLRRAGAPGTSGRVLAGWIGLNALPLLLFLPWLPAAVESVLNWPKGGVTVGLASGLEKTLSTLVFGPLHAVPQPQWPWLAAGALLPLLGLVGLLLDRCMRRFAWPLALWLGLPIVLMAGLGLFSDAFLKFLITAAPAWCLLLACAPALGRREWVRWGLAGVTAAFAVTPALLLLPPYYHDAHARDNYAGVAAYLAASGNVQYDLVILDAPGQQEVWRYYDPGLPTLALPETRPPDPAAVHAALAEATADRRTVYALFWATDEADPQRLVEGWLDRNAFKSLDAWQGNLRLAIYALADRLQPGSLVPVTLGESILLAGQAQPEDPQHVLPGEAALVQLRWEALADLDERFKVSVQLLDAAGQVVAQRDSEPQGGSRPTDTWRAGEQVLDNYALPLPLGTPPGSYRLVAALYDAQNGERLRHPGGDLVELGSVLVDRPGAPAPVELLPLAQRLDHPLGPLTLLGYDAYRKDFAHAPQTPLAAGDMAHVVLYWQAPNPLPVDWPADLTVTLRLGEQSASAPVGGPAYPTSQWQAGEVVRSQMDILYDGTSTQAVIEVAGESLTLPALMESRP